MKQIGWIVLLGLAAASAPGAVLPRAEVDNRRCLNCHGQQHIAQDSPQQRLTMVKSPASGPAGPTSASSPSTQAPLVRPELYLSPNAFTSGVHTGLKCADCHQTAVSLPHDQKLPPATCGSACHAKPAGDFLQGAHAEAAAKGNPQTPTCATCHGGHDILPKHDRRSRTYPLNIVKVCGDCHQQLRAATPGGHSGKDYVQSYFDSVHGKALVRGGLAVVATCADCHGEHLVLPGNDPRSPTHRGRVARTCGQCHVGVNEVYQQSIHGQRLAQGDPKAPVCTDCHTAHTISRTNAPSFMLDIVSECGQCHDQPPPGSKRRTSLYETYRRSYHGQTNELGSTRAARCSDCHGAHDIRRIDDPLSRLNAENRVETCRRCHKEANAAFAAFEPHADYRDSARYPLLHAVWLYFVILMSFAFGFFGLHSLLWLIRSVIERIRQGPRPAFVANPHAIKRFNRVDRINHLFVIISFFGLSLTGLPLLFAYQGWAKELAVIMGGVRGAGLLHRFFAVMLICNLLVHVVGLVRRFRRFGVRAMLFGPTTMLPRKKDVMDCLGMFRWFFRGGKKPQFDRWTYWEKFDYTAEVFGSVVIGLSGLLLWFPQFFAKFMPGWMFNVATVIHGYEALLAVGFIFTIHFFNAHLRLEKFPVDDVIFTGQLSEQEFRHERGAEYARLVENGQLEALRVRPASRWFHRLAVMVGVTAMAIGTTLVVLIVLAGMGAI
jgi:cytochrome b subunit of formate dehydrogenase